MATFDSADELADEKTTKALLKTALAKVNANGIKFLYYEKFKLGAKDVPLVLVDFSPNLQSQVKAKFGKAPTASGRCMANKQDELVFEAESGSMKLEGLKTFLNSVGVPRAVCTDDNSPPQATPQTSHAKTLDGPPPDAKQDKQNKPPTELVTRLSAFKNQLKALKPDLRESFEMQLIKVATLAAKDEAAALKLLAQLEPMLKKASAQEAPDIGDLKQALADAKQAVGEALAKLPDQPPQLNADVQATPEFQRYDALVRSPASISDVKTLKSAVGLLVQRIDGIATLASEWPKIKAEENDAVKKLMAESLVAVGKANLPKLGGYKDVPEAKLALALGNEAQAYAKVDAFRQAMQGLRQAVHALVKDIQAWDLAVTQAQKAVQQDLAKLDGDLQAPVGQALSGSNEQTALDQMIEAGKKAVLPLGPLQQAGQQLLVKLAELADVEQRRKRARQLTLDLAPKREEADKRVTLCDARLNAIANLDAAALSWRDNTSTQELAADQITCAQARALADTLRQDIDTALIALGQPVPPAKQVLDNAQNLAATVLAPVSDATKRITTNVNAISVNGRYNAIQAELLLAINNPLQQLSKTRAGQITGEAQKNNLSRQQVQQAITAQLLIQHQPPLKEWFKVMQLGNASGGQLKLVNVGGTQATGRRTDMHLSLYVKNVGAAPSVTSPIQTIMDTLLPEVDGDVGTHVTMELLGAKVKGNPHVFHGEPAGRPGKYNWGEGQWAVARQDMQDALDRKIAEVRASVVQFCQKMGRLGTD